MSTKLTNTSRGIILRKILDHRFHKEDLELKLLTNSVAMTIFNGTYTKAERELLSTLPENFVNKVNRIVGTIAGRYIHLYFYNALGGHAVVGIPSQERMCVFDAGSPEHAALERLENKQIDLKDLRDKASSNITAVLYSVSTEKQLLEIWPAVRPFLQSRSPACRALPVVQIDALNAMLDLPVEEDEEASV